MVDPCSIRRFSWLVKSCLPDPRRDITKTSLVDSIKSTASPISSLPDDLLLECLARVPLSSLPSLPLVCRRFSLLLYSPAFLVLRRSHARLRPMLYAFSFSDLGIVSSASLPLDDPNASWAETTSQVAFWNESLDATFSHARLVPMGRFLFLIGRGATLRYDAWTGAVHQRAPTLFPRRKFAAAALGGLIYVAGGAARTSAVEEYDPSTDSWRVVAEAPRRRYGCVGAAAGGVFYVAGGLRVGGSGEAGAGGRMEAHVWAGSMDGLDVGAGTWVSRGAARAAAVPGGGCVVGACGAGAHVYVVASHAVEVSFWRWEAVPGPGRRGGEWTRLEPPPVPGRVRLGGAVRFSCCAVGEAKVVALVHVSDGCAAVAARRGIGSVEGAVLVYDILRGEWTRGPDLPAGFRRAAIACIDC